MRGTLAAIEKSLAGRWICPCVTTPRCRPMTACRRAVRGAFLACSFWLVDAYVLQEHRLAGTRASCSSACWRWRNDVGLLSEEYDPRTRRLVGNFPQAFTSRALRNSAFNLTRIREACGAARSARERGLVAGR